MIRTTSSILALSLLVGAGSFAQVSSIPTHQPNFNPNKKPATQAVTTPALQRKAIIRKADGSIITKTLSIGATPQSEVRAHHSKVNKKQNVRPAARAETAGTITPLNTVRNLPVGQSGQAATAQAPRASQSSIYIFPSVTTQAAKGQLQVQLQNTDPALRLATAADFALNANSQCLNTSATCVIVSEKLVAAFEAGVLAGYANASNIGFISHGIRPTAKNPVGPSARQSVGGSRSGFQSSYGTSLFSYDNINPNTYYIPDAGYNSNWSQYAGAWLPTSTASIISPTAKITSVSFDINIYHTYHHDLIVQFGYDAVQIGGPNYTLANYVANRPSNYNGFRSYTGTTHEFDGLHPDSFYYVNAWDAQANDYGYINYIDYTVEWVDFPNLTFLSTGNSLTTPLPQERYLSVTNSVFNDSYVDVNPQFSLGWYIEKDTSSAQNCSALSYDPASANVWLAGYADFAGLVNGGYSSVGLNSFDLDTLAANNAGYFMGNGNYCLWSYVDDLSEITESDEAGIDPAFVPWDNIIDMGGFRYTYQSFNPDLTFDYGSNNNYYTINNAGDFTAHADVINDSPTAANGTFEIAWYLTRVNSPSDCTSPSLNLDANTAFFMGAQNLTYVAPYTGAGSQVATAAPANVNMNYAQDSAGNYPTTGYYCVWAWVDDFNTVAEGTEDNNVIVYASAIGYGSVGINETALASSINLYPNPAHDIVNLDLPTDLQSQEITINVYNVAGQAVVAQQQSIFGSKATLDVTSLSAGIYTVTIQSKSGDRATKTLVKAAN